MNSLDDIMAERMDVLDNSTGLISQSNAALF
jgi:hypothetical protein